MGPIVEDENSLEEVNHEWPTWYEQYQHAYEILDQNQCLENLQKEKIYLISSTASVEFRHFPPRVCVGGGRPFKLCFINS